MHTDCFKSFALEWKRYYMQSSRQAVFQQRAYEMWYSCKATESHSHLGSQMKTLEENNHNDVSDCILDTSHVF